MPHLSTYVGLADRTEESLSASFRIVGEGHADVADIFHMTGTLATMSDDNRRRLAPVVERYGEDDELTAPDRLHVEGIDQARAGQVGLLRDLQDLHVLATFVKTTWLVITQGAQGLRDRQLLDVAETAMAQTSRQVTWLETRLKAAAPQALIVTPHLTKTKH